MLTRARRQIEKIVDIIGEILAFFTVLLLILMLINGMAGGFLGGATAALTRILFIAVVVTVGLKGLEFALKTSGIFGLLLTIIFAGLLVCALVFMFIPSTIPGWFNLDIFGNGGAVCETCDCVCAPAANAG